MLRKFYGGLIAVSDWLDEFGFATLFLVCCLFGPLLIVVLDADLRFSEGIRFCCYAWAFELFLLRSILETDAKNTSLDIKKQPPSLHTWLVLNRHVLWMPIFLLIGGLKQLRKIGRTQEINDTFEVRFDAFDRWCKEFGPGIFFLFCFLFGPLFFVSLDDGLRTHERISSCCFIWAFLLFVLWGLLDTDAKNEALDVRRQPPSFHWWCVLNRNLLWIPIFGLVGVATFILLV